MGQDRNLTLQSKEDKNLLAPERGSGMLPNSLN